MSTYVYLECVDHDPPLRADDESGQHLYDLNQLREDIANRETIIGAAKLDIWPGERFRRNTAVFLVAHPKCALRITDEYGVEHPLIEPPAVTP